MKFMGLISTALYRHPDALPIIRMCLKYDAGRSMIDLDLYRTKIFFKAWRKRI